jgi:integrase/recombinase XerD
VLDGLLEHSPAEHVRRPKIDTESATLGLDRMELAAFIAQAEAAGVIDHALACLLGLLGLRVAEACSIDIEDLSTQRGHRCVTVVGKGSKLAVIPLPPRVARAVDLAAGERCSGPLLLTRAGNRMNRQSATRIVRRLATAAGVTKHISPHSLRHSSLTTVSTRASPCETSKSRPATPILGPPPATTGPATTLTATPATSSPPSSPAPARP